MDQCMDIEAIAKAARLTFNFQGLGNIKGPAIQAIGSRYVPTLPFVDVGTPAGIEAGTPQGTSIPLDN